MALVLATTGKWIFRVSRDVNWLNYWQCPWIHSQSSCSTLPNRSNTIGMLATFHHRDKILLINNIKIYLAHGLRYFSPRPFGHLVYACGKAEHHGQDSIIDLSCSLHGGQETEWAREERYRNKKKKICFQWSTYSNKAPSSFHHLSIMPSLIQMI